MTEKLNLKTLEDEYNQACEEITTPEVEYQDLEKIIGLRELLKKAVELGQTTGDDLKDKCIRLGVYEQRRYQTLCLFIDELKRLSRTPQRFILVNKIDIKEGLDLLTCLDPAKPPITLKPQETLFLSAPSSNYFFLNTINGEIPFHLPGLMTNQSFPHTDGRPSQTMEAQRAAIIIDPTLKNLDPIDAWIVYGQDLYGEEVFKNPLVKKVLYRNIFSQVVSDLLKRKSTLEDVEIPKVIEPIVASFRSKAITNLINTLGHRLDDTEISLAVAENLSQLEEPELPFLRSMENRQIDLRLVNTLKEEWVIIQALAIKPEHIYQVLKLCISI